MTAQSEQRGDFWRPLVVRGVPLHYVVPVASAALGIALMLAGGFASFIGGWLLAVGFPLAVGAFVADRRALAAPAILWGAWLVAVALTGPASPVPQTPVIVALGLAGLGTAATWLGQRAVQPAVEDPHGGRHPHRRLAPDLDELLAPDPDASNSPSLDPGAEVDEALAAMLDEPIDATEPAPGQRSRTEEIDAATDGDSLPDVEAEGTAREGADTGQVIEFAALRQEDLDALDDAEPLDSTTPEAGR